MPSRNEASLTGELETGGETRDDLKDVHDLHTHVREQFSLEERVSMLNDDQSRIFKQVTQHLCHQKQHETGSCMCSALKPLHMFISGVGGTGKSFLIEMIRAKVGEIWDKSEAFTCAVAAPTGLAAFNVGGVTVLATAKRFTKGHACHPSRCEADHR